MIQLPWVVGGLIFGLVVATVLIPPTRKVPSIPDPKDPSALYRTETGCVRLLPTEVPCTSEPDSFNLLAFK
jgi:hypothetical protein